MNFFGGWAFYGGITVIVSYGISTLDLKFFTYNSFLLVFTAWLILGIYATYDLIKDARKKG